MKWVDEKRNLVRADLDAVERSFSVRLPETYVELQLSHHGARPSPNRFDTFQRKGAMVKTFLPVRRDQPGNLYEVSSWLTGRIPENMIPFAGDAGGNYVCFVYASHQAEPLVVLWNHERSFTYEFVADSFDEFLNGLY